jgi:hypothetical protein
MVCDLGPSGYTRRIILSFGADRCDKLSWFGDMPDNWKPCESPRAIEVSPTTTATNPSGFRLRIKIEDTALESDALGKWIKLTLDQCLAAWMIERHLELQQRSKNVGTSSELKCGNETFLQFKNVCPGLPTLVSLLNDAHKIPSPAVKKWESFGIVGSSRLSLPSYFVYWRIRF